MLSPRKRGVRAEPRRVWPFVLVRTSSEGNVRRPRCSVNVDVYDSDLHYLGKRPSRYSGATRKTIGSSSWSRCQSFFTGHRLLKNDLILRMGSGGKG
jgi:hypothetical protein